MKELLLNNWNLWRVVRLILSIIFIVEGLLKTDTVLIFGGIFLFGHAILNACVTCAGGSCEISKNK